VDLIGVEFTRGATLRRTVVNILARLGRSQRRPILHLPGHCPWTHHWLAMWRTIIGYSPPTRPQSSDHRRKADRTTMGKAGQTSDYLLLTRRQPPQSPSTTPITSNHGSRLGSAAYLVAQPD
jgi:hypothetical protein